MLVGRRPVRTLAALRPVEVALGILREAGLPPWAALRAFRTLSHYAYGHALSEIRGMALDDASKQQGPSPETLQAEADSFPNLISILPEATPTDHDAEFEEGLAVIVEGLRRVYGLQD